MNAPPRVHLPGFLPLRLLGKALLCTAMALPPCWANADDASQSANHVLIADQFNDRVIEVTRAKRIVFQQGKLNVAGDGFNQLNGPYDAKVVGDFTGLTPPCDVDPDD